MFKRTKLNRPHMGSALSEYGLAVTLIALATIGGLTLLGQQLGGKLGTVNKDVSVLGVMTGGVIQSGAPAQGTQNEPNAGVPPSATNNNVIANINTGNFNVATTEAAVAGEFVVDPASAVDGTYVTQTTGSNGTVEVLVVAQELNTLAAEVALELGANDPFSKELSRLASAVHQVADAQGDIDNYFDNGAQGRTRQLENALWDGQDGMYDAFYSLNLKTVKEKNPALAQKIRQNFNKVDRISYRYDMAIFTGNGERLKKNGKKGSDQTRQIGNQVCTSSGDEGCQQ